MSNLVTTNVRIPEDDYKKYKKLAEKQGKSFAFLVRHALKNTYTNLKMGKKKKKSFWDVKKHAIYIPGLKKGESIDEVVYMNPHGRQK